MPQKTAVAFQAIPKDGVSVTDLAHMLREAGAKDVQLLESIGVVTGSIADNQLQKLSEIEGLRALEKEQTYQLPPPNSEIQ
jgi:hypothetical protein